MKHAPSSAQVAAALASPPDLDALADSLLRLARGELTELEPLLKSVHTHVQLDEVAGICHLHAIALDGNGRPRLRDLMTYLADCVLDYAIPRSEIVAAKEAMDASGATTKLLRLVSEAKALFADVVKSGEGGELLLFLLAERFLKLPQLLCKMNLKTSTNMHVHGSDGLHVGTGPGGKLALYWLESKVYQSFDSALAKCFSDLAVLLTDTNAFQSRDLQLVSRHMDLSDLKLENALRPFLIPGDKKFNDLEFRGLALVGFDSDCYPADPNTSCTNDVCMAAAASFDSMKQKIVAKAKASGLASFVIHVFCLPVPSAEDFRKEFRRALGYGDGTP